MHDSPWISAGFPFLGRDMDAIRRRVRPTHLGIGVEVVEDDDHDRRGGRRRGGGAGELGYSASTVSVRLRPRRACASV